MLESLINSLKEYVLLQYLYMQKTRDFGEAGPARVKSDFARFVLGLPPQHTLSVSELDKFDAQFVKYQKLSQEEIKQKLDSYSFVFGKIKYQAQELDLLNQALADAGCSERLFMGERKQGFRIVLFGPVKIMERSGHAVYILGKEIVRSPAAIIPMLAITNSKQEIIVRQNSLEYVFWKKWVQGTNASSNPYLKPTLLSYGIKRRSELSKIKQLFIDEMLETTIVHELCHAVLADNFSNQDMIILAKLVSAVIPNCPLTAIDELLAEWMPAQFGNIGVIPYMAEVAKKDHAKATRMFFRYLADSWFGAGVGQDYMQQTGELFLATVRPYIQGNAVNFSLIEKNSEQIYAQLIGVFQKYLNLALSRIKKAEFSYNGLSVSFNDLARVQHRKFSEQDVNLDKNSSLYKRYFWANMLRYLRNCSQETFARIINDMRLLSYELVNTVSV